ncbi:hypothetical protein [Candidatus Leptofilum sp.]|uniref:hypothetical protein n=1 Tax=Candidatus Leptofilum sp. TaxID=3241576 RepID=UPI003B5A3179
MEDSTQKRLWQLGCGCLGMVGCLILLLILLALVGVMLFGLIFTAPPLEFMSGFNDFLGNDVGWLLAVLIILALVVGGFGGAFVGKTIADARANSS